MEASSEQNHECKICGEVFTISKQIATIQALITVEKRQLI
jgi:hypothetical protein